jgi:hypothetical protein
MLPSPQTNLINYLVLCVSEFAQRFQMDSQTAYRYLADHGGLRFLIEHYETEHTLGLDDVMEDLKRVCAETGGSL